MKKYFIIFTIAALMCSVTAAQEISHDVIKTKDGDLELWFVGHGTLMFKFDGMVIHIDPVGREADYAKLPDADLILVTHEHGDHLDAKAIGDVTKEGTEIVLTEICKKNFGKGTVMKNGDSKTFKGFKVEAVAAYNIKHMRSENSPYHPKGAGNGYIITFGDTRVYVAGDSENTPEMKKLKDIDIAFLPMNLPYTMTPEMVADAAKAFQPKILYPYHFGRTDTDELLKLMKDVKGVDVRIRELS